MNADHDPFLSVIGIIADGKLSAAIDGDLYGTIEMRQDRSITFPKSTEKKESDPELK